MKSIRSLMNMESVPAVSKVIFGMIMVYLLPLFYSAPGIFGFVGIIGASVPSVGFATEDGDGGGDPTVPPPPSPSVQEASRDGEEKSSESPSGDGKESPGEDAGKKPGEKAGQPVGGKPSDKDPNPKADENQGKPQDKQDQSDKMDRVEDKVSERGSDKSQGGQLFVLEEKDLLGVSDPLVKELMKGLTFEVTREGNSLIYTLKTPKEDVREKLHRLSQGSSQRPQSSPSTKSGSSVATTEAGSSLCTQCLEEELGTYTITDAGTVEGIEALQAPLIVGLATKLVQSKSLRNPKTPVLSTSAAITSGNETVGTGFYSDRPSSEERRNGLFCQKDGQYKNLDPQGRWGLKPLVEYFSSRGDETLRSYKSQCGLSGRGERSNRRQGRRRDRESKDDLSMSSFEATDSMDDCYSSLENMVSDCERSLDDLEEKLNRAKENKNLVPGICSETSFRSLEDKLLDRAEKTCDQRSKILSKALVKMINKGLSEDPNSTQYKKAVEIRDALLRNESSEGEMLITNPDQFKSLVSSLVNITTNGLFSQAERMYSDRAALLEKQGLSSEQAAAQAFTATQIFLNQQSNPSVFGSVASSLRQALDKASGSGEKTFNLDRKFFSSSLSDGFSKPLQQVTQTKFVNAQMARGLLTSPFSDLGEARTGSVQDWSQSSNWSSVFSSDIFNTPNQIGDVNRTRGPRNPQYGPSIDTQGSSGSNRSRDAILRTYTPTSSLNSNGGITTSGSPGGMGPAYPSQK